jgi:hypothetical protein
LQVKTLEILFLNFASNKTEIRFIGCQKLVFYDEIAYLYLKSNKILSIRYLEKKPQPITLQHYTEDLGPLY